MKKATNLLIIILFGTFFTAIFYKQQIGLNLFLFNILILVLLHWVYKALDFKNELHIAVVSGSLLTAVGTLVHASTFVITMNILSLVLLFGVVNNRQARLLLNTAFSAIFQYFTGIISLFQRNEHTTEQKPKRIKNFWRWIGLALIPLFVLVVFFQLYSASSSKFSAVFSFIGEFINKAFLFVFDNLNFALLFLFLFGVVIACGYFVRTKQMTTIEEATTDILERKRNRYYGHSTGLLNEFRMGMIMFSLLNVLLVIFNLIDIWHVWIHFEWSGDLLKEFVHEGTYTLIVTLFISIALVLVFFRKNLNFFSKNRPLKILANIWIAQNAIMATSVLIRNIHYINYYNLAYLRIGVLLFIVIAFFGLITVFVKINKMKNFYYLLRVNMLFTYVALVLFSLPDWDVMIAKVNFSRADKAFVHLDFMVKLDDKALPYLDKEIDIQNIEKSPVYQLIGKGKEFLTPEDYKEAIAKRKSSFINDYPNRTFLEWNLADRRAYKKLEERLKKNNEI